MTISTHMTDPDLVSLTNMLCDLEASLSKLQKNVDENSDNRKLSKDTISYLNSVSDRLEESLLLCNTAQLVAQYVASKPCYYYNVQQPQGTEDCTAIEEHDL